MASAVDLPAVKPNCSDDIYLVVSRKQLSLSFTNFSRRFAGIDNRLMPRYHSTERSLVLSIWV
jgi:hypothetical protein